MKPDSDLITALPQAVLRPVRRFSRAWLIPLISALLLLGVIYYALERQSVQIQVQFRHGHGLKPGDAVRYRGIEVGSVRQVALADDLNSIQVAIRLESSARDLARQGSRFWIVRPQIGLSGISGLETMIGANYLSVLPGDGDPQQSFAGLETPPLIETLASGGLEITLCTPNKGNLRPGAPVSYRQVVIGAIINVGLARDAGAVEVGAYILPDYMLLIGEHARFWKTGGATLSAGFRGVSFQLESLLNLMEGGINLALPPDGGKPVAAGHRFRLDDDPEPEWLNWKPFLDLRKTTRNQTPPVLLRAQATWVRFWGKQERQAWVLPVAQGFLGPADVLAADQGRKAENREILLHGVALPLVSQAQPYQPGLVILPYPHQLPPWPKERFRHASVPENTVIIAGDGLSERFVEKKHYTVETGYWRLDPALTFEEKWHGAGVISDHDQALLGILLIDGRQAKMIPVRSPDTPPTPNP